MYCKKCGNLLNENEKFCSRCGEAVESKNDNLIDSAKSDGLTNNSVNNNFNVGTVGSNANNSFAGNSNNSNDKKNKQVIYIVGGVCTLVLVFCLFNSIKGIFGGATSVGVGETLKINNKDYKLNIKAGNIEDYTSTDSEQYKILKLDVTNNNSESAQMGVTFVSGINFSLVDNQNSEIASSNPYLSKSYLVFDTGFNNKILESSIPAHQSTDGYLLFKTNSDSIDKLKIDVISADDCKMKNGKTDCSTSNTYYIKLN